MASLEASIKIAATSKVSNRNIESHHYFNQFQNIFNWIGKSNNIFLKIAHDENQEVLFFFQDLHLELPVR